MSESAIDLRKKKKNEKYLAQLLFELLELHTYEVLLLNNETGYEKGFYYKNYFTFECFPSIYSPSLATHLSIRFFY